MFNFTKAERNAVLFTVIILLISGIYHLISPTKSIQPIYDYSASDSIFKRLSQKLPPEPDTMSKLQALPDPKESKSKPIYKTVKPTTKIEKLLFNSININTASEKELQRLPRIGPAKAKLIVEFRNKNGKFNYVEELLEIKGIGKKTLEKLKPYLLIN